MPLNPRALYSSEEGSFPLEMRDKTGELTAALSGMISTEDTTSLGVDGDGAWDLGGRDLWDSL